jgi:hypothetical protein
MDGPSSSTTVGSIRPPQPPPHRPTREQLKEVERQLEQLSQRLYEMEEKAAHVFPGQEEFMMEMR